MNPQTVRTSGDGIENPEKLLPIESTFKRSQKLSSTSSIDADKIDKLGKEYLSKQFEKSSHQILYNPTVSDSQATNYPPPKLPKGKKFYLIPKLVTPNRQIQALRNRKLNLILMEPYKVSLCRSRNTVNDMSRNLQPSIYK